MNWAFLVQSNPGIESTICAQHIQCSFSIIALPRLINLRCCQYDQSSPKLVPLQLYLVTSEEGLLRNRSGELWDVEDLDGRWLALVETLARPKHKT